LDMLQPGALEISGGVAQAVHAAHIGVVAFSALRLQEAFADMIIGAGALQIFRAADAVALRDALAAAILDGPGLFGPFAKPGVVVADVTLKAKADAVDLPDFGAAPGRHVQADQEAMRPAVVLRKIDERQFFLFLAHANSHGRSTTRSTRRLIPRLQFAETLPALAVEAHELHLVDRDVIGRRGIDPDAG